MPGFFDGFVAINQLPNNEESFTAYILTRPFDLSSVKAEHAHKIHTSTNLKWGMIYKYGSEVQKKVNSFDDNGMSYCVDLPNGKTLIISSYKLNTFTLKVVILFEYVNVYSIYYDGHITDPQIIINKPKLWNLIKLDKIDQLLLDTTSIQIEKYNITETACKKIVKILRANKEFQMNLILEEFGQEDLLAALVDRGVKIWLDANRDIIFARGGPKNLTFSENQVEADIFISNEMPTKIDILRQFKDENIATMAFCTSLDYEMEKNSSEKGIFWIEYTPHQTFRDAYYLAQTIAPKEIVPIQSDAVIPSSLKEFCFAD